VDVTPVLELIAARRSADACTLVGIGGHGGAGKSTLAAAIPGAQVVPTDAFWNGDGFDIGRIRSHVLDPLLRGREARYAAWDWAGRRPAGVRAVRPRGVVVVEGVCALHRLLRDAYAVRVWVDAPAELRLERGVARDGEAARATWLEVWMPREDRYVASDDPAACADLVVDGSRALARQGGTPG
jgi:uridine kinase